MILIATHDPVRRERWREAIVRLNEAPSVETTFKALRRRLAVNPNALVLLDLGWPCLQEGDALEALLAEFYHARFLVFSSHCTDAEGESLVQVGVQGYLSVQAGAERVAEALAHVLKGEMWLSRHLMASILRHYQQATVQRRSGEVCSGLIELTPRQQEVALTVAKGLSNKAIARHLDISERTVKSHLTAIFERTMTQSRTELVSLLGGMKAK